jgi:hypothetical protein
MRPTALSPFTEEHSHSAFTWLAAEAGRSSTEQFATSMLRTSRRPTVFLIEGESSCYNDCITVMRYLGPSSVLLRSLLLVRIWREAASSDGRRQ